MLVRFNHLAATVFGGSLHVRHVDTGSCNACEWELNALLNPVYDVSRMRIEFVASPRHADVLAVTGGVTRNLLEALRMTYEATAWPKAVVAIGGCAIGDGLIGKTYAQEGGIAPFVPIHVKVPGCPPRPQEILAGFLHAMECLTHGVEQSGS
ncbi:oxidoreductase [Sulfoacidibacillus thermotolerans]|uniref:Oxidoreductase n=1 Tax=Sulfoacidibacillus thermotolerans TaxID=1765684 RepID=A0A2U3D840_SULT2|nr:oxidoreductase [Sulfoacidibacillus thermotolerans]